MVIEISLKKDITRYSASFFRMKLQMDIANDIIKQKEMIS